MANLEKVGECLYRYAATGMYHARFDVPSPNKKRREVRRSLGTIDRPTAKRKLADLQRQFERTGGAGEKLTLAALCDRYLATTGDQSAATIYRKKAIARRVQADFPGGSHVVITKVVPSQISTWLASYRFGESPYNLHLEFVRAAFALAVADGLVADPPAAGLKGKKLKKPIRQTPTFEEFEAIALLSDPAAYGCHLAPPTAFANMAAPGLNELSQGRAPHWHRRADVATATLPPEEKAADGQHPRGEPPQAPEQLDG